MKIRENDANFLCYEMFSFGKLEQLAKNGTHFMSSSCLFKSKSFSSLSKKVTFDFLFLHNPSFPPFLLLDRGLKSRKGKKVLQYILLFLPKVKALRSLKGWSCVKSNNSGLRMCAFWESQRDRLLYVLYLLLLHSVPSLFIVCGNLNYPLFFPMHSNLHNSCSCNCDAFLQVFPTKSS